MHDPMVVAFEVRRPWPEFRRIQDARPRGILGAHWRFGNVELYWPALITVWHVEPNGADSLTVCDWRTTKWQWHVHHWKLQLHPWQHFKRWAFTRCAWCGGPSRRRDPVNVSRGWEPDRSHRWWQSPPGIYHHDCLSIEEAHRECLCPDDVGMWDQGGVERRWGNCATCGGFRRWRYELPRIEDLTRDKANALLRTIPRGKRDPEVTARVTEIWRNFRESAAA